MRLTQFAVAASCAAISIAAPAAAASYLPTGPQTNVATSTVTGGGWTQCFVGSYGAFGPSVASVLDGCSGSKLMLAARANGSGTLLLLAQADRADVLFEEGTSFSGSHNANGSEWYFSDSWSWGFANGGDAVARISCDIPEFFSGGANLDLRLCWHTGGGNMNGGFRIGTSIFLNDSADFEKVIYSFNGVPEPATWGLMIAGFGLVGAAARRRRTAVAA